MQKEEKKVEYLELIYDLIFVYIIGRNNSLLHHVENGFVDWRTFLAFALSSLAVIQIWNFSTFYVNLYGRNGVRDHVFMFLNMYLLYYIGEGTRVNWEQFQPQYHIAWALILVNLGAQYLIEGRLRPDPVKKQTVRRMSAALFGEAAIVLAAIPVFRFTGVQLAGVAILYGIAATGLLFGGVKNRQVDFMHLSERAMLYVVFTFGEMIIAIASYFDGDFSLRSVYFSAACFLIAVGLFLCYELLYDRLLDRARQTTGLAYMAIHIFLVFALNCITASLEFMRDEAVAVLPKTLFLTASFLLFFACLLLMMRYRRRELGCMRVVLPAVSGLSLLFAAGMLLLREQMAANIALSVVYVAGVFLTLFFSRRLPVRTKTDAG